MRISMLLLAALLAAVRTPAIQDIGREKLPPGVVDEIGSAAASEGIQIVAVETLTKSGFIDISFVVAYGPVEKKRAGVCRGVLYMVSAPEAASASKWEVIPLAGTRLPMSYALVKDCNDERLSSRILINGTLSDDDFLEIVDRVRRAREKNHSQSRDTNTTIDAKFVIDEVRIGADGQHATVLMVDASGDGELNVLLAKSAGKWVIHLVGLDAAWGD